MLRGCAPFSCRALAVSARPQSAGTHSGCRQMTGSTSRSIAAQPLVPPNPAFATVENDRRLTRATLQAARSYVTTGFPTLVEMDVVGGQRREVCEDVFRRVPFLLVVLTARRDVAMRGVEERGTEIQSLETFRAMYDAVAWEDIPAAATIDTSDHPADRVAAMVAGLIDDST